MSAKRVSFKTVGCRLNQAETAEITASFKRAGYRTVPFGEETDVCVIHTCAITANAEKTCLRFARSCAAESGSPFIVLAGCAVENSGATLEKDSAVDMIVGQSDKFRIPELLQRRKIVSGAESSTECSAPEFETTRALIKVQDGCSFFCSYCIVPYTRGAPKSRQAGDILKEIRELTSKGYKEFVLTGANIGCYDSAGTTLPDLLSAIEAVPEVTRIRLSSIELSTAEDTVLSFMRQSKKLCHYLHVPMQSGDDTILKSMGRRYSAQQYRDFMIKAAQEIPFLGLGTDIITGFPGETDEMFNNTLNMVRETKLNNLHVFPFSIRSGTKAENMRDQIPRAVKKERVKLLVEAGSEQRKRFAESFIGRDVTFLAERITEQGEARGWTDEYLEVKVTAPQAHVNDIITFKPLSAADAILCGKAE